MMLRCMQGVSRLSRVQARSYYTTKLHEPIAPISNKRPTACSSDEAVQLIQSGMNVFLHTAAATPSVLVAALARRGRGGHLRDVTLTHIHTECEAEFVKPEFQGIFRSNSLFIGSNVRQAVNDGLADYTPIFLSEIPLLFRRGLVKLDAALVQVSPPDRHGFCSLGVSVDCTRAALQAANIVIGQVNKHMPRTHGDGIIHVSHFDRLVEADVPLPQRTVAPPDEVEAKIGRLIADNLVDDGATLQMGIGAIPDAVLASLRSHRHLGIHTEMFSDGVIPLVENGAVDNALKNTHKGKIVSGFVVGSSVLYDWLDDNPMVNMLDIEYVNSGVTIAQQSKMTAINSAIEVDLTGQVAADSIGTRLYSGVGGQVDFIRGAGQCPDGKPIIALPSTTSRGETRIVPLLKPGAGVVTTRAHVRFVVTEYGIAYLFGKCLRERARALIDVAHPAHREALEKAAFERLKCVV